MSDVKAIRYLLANNAPLVAVVPVAKIKAGPIQQGTTLPAISVSHVSTMRRYAIASAPAEFCTSRVQITVMAKSYPEQKSILTLIRAALPRTRGSVNGVIVDSLLKDIDGPDFREDEVEIYMQSLDYIITYSE
jgi:hypothetical protein